MVPKSSLNVLTGRLWMIALALHICGMALYLDWSEILTNPPVVDGDYATHWIRVWSVSHFLDHGHFWGYDPYFMAGHPEGTIFNVDNKLFEIASWSLSKLGIPLTLSFNLVLATIVLIAPLSLWPAARWLGLDKQAANIGQLAGLALWYLDPALRWSWQGSTLAFAATVCLSLLVLAAAVQIVRHGRGATRAVWLVWLVLGPFLFWLHALAFLLLLPLALLVLLFWRRMSWPRRWALVLWPPWVVLLNLPWLVPALRFAWAKTESNQYLQGGIPALAADLLGIGDVDGASTVSLLGPRWLILAFGGLGLLQSTRRNPALWPVLAGVCAGFLIAYGAVYIPGGDDLTPYRFIEQAALWSVVGFLPGLRWLWARLNQLKPAAAFRVAAAGAVVLSALWLAYAGWRFRPPFLGGPAYDRWQGPSEDVKAVCRYLEELPLDEGRILLDDARLGALLPWCSGAEVIGGHFFDVWTAYGYANAGLLTFLRLPYQAYDVREWQSALQTYRIRWIIANDEWAVEEWYTMSDWLDEHPDQVLPGPRFGPYQFYTPRLTSPLEPAPVQASHGMLHIQNVPPGETVLVPYHWLPGLRTAPAGIPVQPHYIGDDPIPFIAIGPADGANVIICSYRECPP